MFTTKPIRKKRPSEGQRSSYAGWCGHTFYEASTLKELEQELREDLPYNLPQYILQGLAIAATSLIPV